MAKGKGKKGAKGGKGKKKPEENPNALTEVDKTFYELQITDLNRKLARLRSLTEQQEIKNEELQQNLAQLDADRNDVIIFLKRTLQEKSDEITEYQARITGLEETRTSETAEFTQKIAVMEEEYKQMHEQLTSEIKLLTGKLNALEEFRLQRDDLMKKFEMQEHAMEEQEQKHKRELYDTERKFIIGKDRLKKEMEARLIRLSNEFQDVTEVRIASTTHRVIRENIAINNELDTMLATHQRYHSENERLKKVNKTLQLDAQLHEKEKEKALATVNVQHDIIAKFTTENDKLLSKLRKLKNLEADNFKLEIELLDLRRVNDKNRIEIRILEQNLHASRCDRTVLRSDLNYAKGEMDRLSGIIYQSVMSIKVALQLTPSEADDYIKREGLLQNLLSVMSKAQEDKTKKPSLESLGSLTAMYATGDLGFVPKPGPYRQPFPLRKNVEAQVTESLNDLASVLPSETGSMIFGRRISHIESTIMAPSESKASLNQTFAEIDNTGDRLVFMDSSELSSSIGSTVVTSTSLLKLDESQVKEATPQQSASQVADNVKVASGKSSASIANLSSEHLSEEIEIPSHDVGSASKVAAQKRKDGK